jgi:DNA-binding response OmpR family regulator
MAKKILVIDDEEHIIKMLESRLRSSGYDVVTASNGAIGLEKVKSEHPDLVIVDMLMPVMDGFTFFKAMKKTPEFSKILIMMLTARSSMRGTFESMDVDEFIAKPFIAEDLLSRVDLLFKNKILVLVEDPFVIEKITKVIKDQGYEACIVNSEEIMIEKARQTKYKVLIAHLALVSKEPQDFIFTMHSFRCREPKVILYSDVNTKGTETSDNLKMDEIKLKWHRAGISNLYDQRVAVRPFSESFKTWVA